MAKRPDRLTPLETQIMGQLWKSSPASVRQVQSGLNPDRSLAYNTVLTVMRLLREKGFLASERVGRTDHYRPLVTRDEMAQRSYRDLANAFFDGSARALASHVLHAEDLNADELQALRQEIDRRMAEQDPE